MTIGLLVPKLHMRQDSALMHSVSLLKSSAVNMGINIDIVETAECKMRFNGKPTVLVRGKKPNFKTLMVRPTFSFTRGDLHAVVIKQFELVGIKTINSYASIIEAKNKIRMLQKLSAARVLMPKSYVVQSSAFLPEIMEDIGRFPVIIKSATGQGGIGVAMIEGKRGLTSILDLLTNSEETSPLIIQEYIREARGKDVRVFLVGGKIVAAMERISKTAGEFRSNFSIGGVVRIAELSREERALARRAAIAMELDVAGVDIVRTKDGPKVLEVNSNPGLKGITKATGKDIAGKILSFAASLE